MNTRKILLSIAFLFIFTGFTFSQNDTPKDTINQLNERGQKTGFWKKYYDNGNLQYEGFFQNNYPTGTFIRYDKDGILKAKMHFKENSKKIYTQFFYPDQSMQAEGLYYAQVKDSIWNFYSKEGFLINKVPFKMDKKHGKEEKYYKNGQLSEESNWRNGIQDGMTIKYHENGETMIRISYMNGRIDGEYSVFNTDGIIIIRGSYENNKRQGKWEYYDDSGNKKDELNYIDGVAENQEELERLEHEQIEMLEKNKGKLKEPTAEDMFNQIPPK